MTARPASVQQEIPFLGRWDTSRGEKIADGVVHIIGLIGAILAGAALLTMAFPHTGPGEYTAAVLYVSALVAVLSTSLLYNMWPLTPFKWVLRRYDHSMIYVLIAATYTPFVVQLPTRSSATMVLVAIWAVALAGMAMKILLPGRFDRLAVLLYLAIGWSGVLLARPLGEILPGSTLTLIAIGGALYSMGVIFYVWRDLRYNSALWHSFVVTAALLHSAAVIDCLALSRI